MSDGTVKHDNGHTYPDRYAPGPNAGDALNTAWEILDSLKPGAMSVEARAYLAGLITAKLHLATRVERERCAKVAEQWRAPENGQLVRASEKIAAAIRDDK